MGRTTHTAVGPDAAGNLGARAGPSAAGYLVPVLGWCCWQLGCCAGPGAAGSASTRAVLAAAATWVRQGLMLLDMGAC